MKYKIKISDLTLNPGNVREYNPEHWSDGNAMDVHTEINEFLDQFVPGDDMGGRYATFLNRLGFDHQTDNGWWNHYAVERKNLISFLKCFFNDEHHDKVKRVQELIKQQKQLSSRQILHMGFVDEIIEMEESLRDEVLELKVETLTA